MHEAHQGKVGMHSKVEVRTRDELATAYTPGVAEPCRRIAACPEDVYRYTFKGNMVAVVCPTAPPCWAWGDIGPQAALPVMEGKAVLFKQFGGVDAFPICIDAPRRRRRHRGLQGPGLPHLWRQSTWRTSRALSALRSSRPWSGSWTSRCFHDDQHGTAVVVTAALINALRVVGKKMEEVHIVLNGPGAAGTAIIKMLMTAGARDIIAVDQFGTPVQGLQPAPRPTRTGWAK